MNFNFVNCLYLFSYYYLIKTTHLQFDWYYLECAIKKQFFWNKKIKKCYWFLQMNPSLTFWTPWVYLAIVLTNAVQLFTIILYYII